MVLEACVGNINEAIRAESKGADRIELCENLEEGGTTPSAGTIKIAKNTLNIPVMVIIRPRGGHFVYSQDEIEVMKYDISICKQIGVKGVVFGFLTKEFRIDIDLTNTFIEYADPLETTFHKAIDKTNNIFDEFNKLLKTDINRVLTSGGTNTALEGKDNINEMVRMSQGKIKIIAAGKVNNANFSEVQKHIHTNEFHGRKIVGGLI